MIYDHYAECLEMARIAAETRQRNRMGYLTATFWMRAADDALRYPVIIYEDVENAHNPH